MGEPEILQGARTGPPAAAPFRGGECCLVDFQRFAHSSELGVNIADVVQGLCFRNEIARLATAPPEQQAVEGWIAEHTDAYTVTRWLPTQPDPVGLGLIVSVEYRYRRNSPRWIHTERTFLVDGNSVSEVVDDD